MSVIKADGYGHGLLHAAEALAATDGYALLDIQDAVRLREAGFRQTILLLKVVSARKIWRRLPNLILLV